MAQNKFVKSNKSKSGTIEFWSLFEIIQVLGLLVMIIVTSLSVRNQYKSRIDGQTITINQSEFYGEKLSNEIQFKD